MRYVVETFASLYGDLAGKFLHSVVRFQDVLGDYQDAQLDAYFKPFMQTSGVMMAEESWDGGVGSIRAKIQGGCYNWDVVQVVSVELLLGCEEGLYEPIDWAAVGGKEQFIEAAVNDCGVGTIVWSTVLAYDGDKVTENPPQSWADFWDTDKYPGKRGLRRHPKYTLEFALMADGVPADQVYEALRTPEGVDRAFAKLDEIKDDIIWWEAGAQAPQLLVAGEVVMTNAWNGRISAANKENNRNFKIVWPESIYAVDSWVILRGTPHKDAAPKFIAFASQPEHQRRRQHQDGVKVATRRRPRPSWIWTAAMLHFGTPAGRLAVKDAVGRLAVA